MGVQVGLKVDQVEMGVMEEQVEVWEVMGAQVGLKVWIRWKWRSWWV